MEEKFKNYLTRRIDKSTKFENLLEFPKYIENCKQIDENVMDYFNHSCKVVLTLIEYSYTFILCDIMLPSLCFS